MEYKINDIAKLAGISTRTLRYYDQISLLTPSKNKVSNYRYYTDEDINKLQQILLYKRLGFPLSTIHELLSNQDKPHMQALLEQRQMLLDEQARINVIIHTIEQTISHLKGASSMSNNEKFEGLKEDLIQKNEEQYGPEIREQYGNETIDASYQKMRKMSKWEFEEATTLEKTILTKLGKLYTSNPTSKEAQDLCALHQKWIQFYWPTYSPEAHIQLVKMYTEDPRFTSYYDKVGQGATIFLYQAMKHYLHIES